MLSNLHIPQYFMYHHKSFNQEIIIPLKVIQYTLSRGSMFKIRDRIKIDLWIRRLSINLNWWNAESRFVWIPRWGAEECPCETFKQKVWFTRDVVTPTKLSWAAFTRNKLNAPLDLKDNQSCRMMRSFNGSFLDYAAPHPTFTEPSPLPNRP